MVVFQHADVVVDAGQLALREGGGCGLGWMGYNRLAQMGGRVQSQSLGQAVRVRWGCGFGWCRVTLLRATEGTLLEAGLLTSGVQPMVVWVSTLLNPKP